MQEMQDPQDPRTIHDEPSDSQRSRSGTKVADKAKQQAEQFQEQGKEYVEKARQQASEYADKAQEQVEVGKDKAAEGMDRTAQAIRERTATQSGITAEAGTKVAEGMERTADYLRQHDTSEMWDDVESYIREHPLQAMAGAIFAGFVFGRIIR